MSLSADEAYELVKNDAPLDFEAIGFRCGLEIHQQLATRKLFSPCRSAVVDPDEVKALTIAQYDRRLRATQSELGETDPAVLAEAKKRRSFRYLAIDGLTSLVELDEEPPHPMSEDALDVTLTFAALLGARPVEEVHIMRKTVIDGSNTSGFQRTALVATGGSVEPEKSTVNGGAPVGIWTIAVEEDSARKVEGTHGMVTYSLDRLGIPLIEVATGPDITNPMHAQATARRLGALLRATGRVRRGLGTIRQDLNVSIAVGDRVEIKGCQDLRAVPRVIEQEVRRQLWLHYIAETLRARSFAATAIGQPMDVTDALANTSSKIVSPAIKKGQTVMGLLLPKWAGLIKGISKDGPRYGREFADHAKIAAGVKGIFHSDELPAYGIEQQEVDEICRLISCGKEDAFVLCVEDEATATNALEAVARCAADALAGAGRTVRVAQPDDSTRYMRPLPGAARMYPETDVPPVRVASEHWNKIVEELPERPEDAIARMEEVGLSGEMAGQVVRDGLMSEFQLLIDDGLDPAMAGRILTQFLPSLNNPERVLAHAGDLATALERGDFAKEAVNDVLAALDNGAEDIAAAIEVAGAAGADMETVDATIDAVIADRLEFVKEKGMAAMGPLMGPVMQKLRGKVDGAVISERLQAAIKKALN